MRSYPVRLVQVLRCTFIYHHILCLLIVFARFCEVWQMHLLVQALPWRPCEKKLTANLVLISGRSAMALASMLHICAVSPEPLLNV